MPDETPPISPERALFNAASFFEKCLAEIHDRNARAKFDGEVTDPEEKMEAEILQDELEEKFANKMDSLYKSLSHGFASSNSPSAPILLTALQEQFRKPFDTKTWSKEFILAPSGLEHGDENYIPTHNQFLREIEIFLPDSQSKATVSGPSSFTSEVIAAAMGKSMAGVESRLDATIKAADRIADGTKVVAKNVRAMSESVKNIDAGVGTVAAEVKAVGKNTESISSDAKAIVGNTQSISLDVKVIGTVSGAIAADAKSVAATMEAVALKMNKAKGKGSKGGPRMSARSEAKKQQEEALLSAQRQAAIGGIECKEFIRMCHKGTAKLKAPEQVAFDRIKDELLQNDWVTGKGEGRYPAWNRLVSRVNARTKTREEDLDEA